MTCPVCRGVGQLDYQSLGGCLCCGGSGVISPEHAAILEKVKADLKVRLDNPEEV